MKESTVQLTEEERAMRDGAYGEGVALALRVLEALGKAFDAQRMVEISRAHVALSNQEADRWFVERLVDGGATCRIRPTVNPGYSLAYFRDEPLLTDEDRAMMERTEAAYKAIGARLTYNCSPYLEGNVPRFGEVAAFSESSATPYVNSVYGARSNRESAQSALCAAVIGRVPLYGLLLTESRKAEVHVHVDARLADEFDYHLLGYAVPRKVGNNRPVFTPAFTGIPQGVSSEALMNLGAELNTAGAVPMYHVVGVTPEAPTLQAAFQGEASGKPVLITQSDLEEQREALSADPGPIDFVLMGCPHLSLDQIAGIAAQLRGRTLAAELNVCTSFVTVELARRMGFLQTIEKAGGRLVPDTCIDQPCWKRYAGKRGASDSPKCAYYAKRRGMTFALRSVTECVEAAIAGEVR
jgi:predicted aconitase